MRCCRLEQIYRTNNGRVGEYCISGGGERWRGEGRGALSKETKKCKLSRVVRTEWKKGMGRKRS